MSLCLLCGIIMYDWWGIDLELCVHFFPMACYALAYLCFEGPSAMLFPHLFFIWFLWVGWLALFQLGGLTSALRSLFAGRVNGKETTLGPVPIVGKWGATIISHSLALWLIFYHSFPPFNKNSILYHFFWFLTIPYHSFPSFFTLSERRILHSLTIQSYSSPFSPKKNTFLFYSLLCLSNPSRFFPFPIHSFPSKRTCSYLGGFGS